MPRLPAFLIAAASCCGVLAEEPAYPFTFDEVDVAPGIVAFIGANFDVMARSAVEREWQQRRGALEPEGLPRG